MFSRHLKKSKSQRGASLVEYALVVALIAVAVLGSVKVLGEKVAINFQQTSDAISGEGVFPLLPDQ